MTALHIFRFVVKCLLLLLLSPFWLAFQAMRWLRFRYVLIRSLTRSGIPRREARLLARAHRPDMKIP